MVKLDKTVLRNHLLPASHRALNLSVWVGVGVGSVWTLHKGRLEPPLGSQKGQGSFYFLSSRGH